MPYVYTAPACVFAHKGVCIYEIYKHDCVEEGARIYWFGYCPQSGDGEKDFDIRDLPNPGGLDPADPSSRDALLRQAIEAGILTGEGVKPCGR